MVNRQLQLLNHDAAWLITIPKRSEFSEPAFHFGERVKFCPGKEGDRTWETGRIVGMKASEQEQWIYHIELDSDSPLYACGIQELSAKQNEVSLVKDSCSVRNQVQATRAWFPTAEAAALLGITNNQLRKLRLNGLFKQGFHYRDTSIPNSGLPRWQWHVERCTQALESPLQRRRGYPSRI